MALSRLWQDVPPRWDSLVGRRRAVVSVAPARRSLQVLTSQMSPHQGLGVPGWERVCFWNSGNTGETVIVLEKRKKRYTRFVSQNHPGLFCSLNLFPVVLLLFPTATEKPFSTQTWMAQPLFFSRR
jgi:hypothetical protein